MVSEKRWQTAWMRSKNNPLLFVTDVLGAKPEPWQTEALEAVGRHDRVSIRSGHGVGKTTLEAWLILWFLLTRQNCKVPVAANSQDQLRDTIWPEIGKWHRQLPEPLKAMIDVQAERIVVVQDPDIADRCANVRRGLREVGSLIALRRDVAALLRAMKTLADSE